MQHSAAFTHDDDDSWSSASDGEQPSTFEGGVGRVDAHHMDTRLQRLEALQKQKPLKRRCAYEPPVRWIPSNDTPDAKRARDDAATRDFNAWADKEEKRLRKLSKGQAEKAKQSATHNSLQQADQQALQAWRKRQHPYVWELSGRTVPCTELEQFFLLERRLTTDTKRRCATMVWEWMRDTKAVKYQFSVAARGVVSSSCTSAASANAVPIATPVSFDELREALLQDACNNGAHASPGAYYGFWAMRVPDFRSFASASRNVLCNAMSFYSTTSQEYAAAHELLCGGVCGRAASTCIEHDIAALQFECFDCCGDDEMRYADLAARLKANTAAYNPRLRGKGPGFHVRVLIRDLERHPCSIALRMENLHPDPANTRQGNSPRSRAFSHAVACVVDANEEHVFLDTILERLSAGHYDVDATAVGRIRRDMGVMFNMCEAWYRNPQSALSQGDGALARTKLLHFASVCDIVFRKGWVNTSPRKLSRLDVLQQMRPSPAAPPTYMETLFEAKCLAQIVRKLSKSMRRQQKDAVAVELPAERVASALLQPIIDARALSEGKEAGAALRERMEAYSFVGVGFEDVRRALRSSEKDDVRVAWPEVECVLGEPTVRFSSAEGAPTKIFWKRRPWLILPPPVVPNDEAIRAMASTKPAMRMTKTKTKQRASATPSL